MPKPSTPATLLVRLPNPLGDVVMATPLLHSLRMGLPQTRIVVAGNAPYGALLDGLDSFDQFLALNRSVPHAQVLRQAQADVALLLPNSWSSVLAARKAGIPRRIGRRNQMRQLLLQHSLPPIPGAAPMTELYADFLPSVGVQREVLAAELVVTGPAKTPLPSDATTGATSLIGVAPGAAFGPSKSYPKELLLSALQELHDSHGFVPVWLGSPNERAMLEDYANSLPFDSVLPATQATGLGEAKALIASCSVVLAMDNGARHMAAALRVPQVVIYGPTHPAWSAHALEHTTILRRDELDCLNCHQKVCPKADHPCMNRIAPSNVVRAVQDAVAAAPST
ncbi:MAG: glycosyltransferase family 9 protein [Planctomycetes bacterium]|nr:glycosyltransferase family 9 protein [Planctomycetota bacterium]MCP4770081.1 glycosyltransferase family 9 protein [Planctomycetota bacterium]MCP4860771.1 glycosyltransferase family 9 protein [Planctomycetota bacterium]